MTEFMQNIVKNNFFFISRDNYLNCKSRMYGYALCKDKIHIGRNTEDENIDLTTPGCYVNIIVNDKDILIQQDYFCSFGLYVFLKNDFWAISNSFYYLIKNLILNYNLEVNQEYVSLFLLQAIVPSSITHTAISEINELSSGQYINIDKSSGDMSICQYNIGKYNVDLFSLNGIGLLDSWCNRYYNVFDTLIRNENPLVIELSGGMDSRAAFAPARHIDLHSKYVGVNSLVREDHCFNEDYKIASEISHVYDFQLNKFPAYNHYPICSQDSIELLFYIKFMANDQFAYVQNIPTELVFRSGGGGGEAHRGYVNKDRFNFINDLIHSTQIPLSNEMIKMATSLLNRTFDYLNEHFKEEIPEAQKLYNYARVKNHFARSYAFDYLRNIVYINPFFDPALFMLNCRNREMQDRNALFALIISRYLPELGSLEFQGRRKYDDSTWNYVKDFNKNIRPFECITNNNYQIEKNALKPCYPVFCSHHSTPPPPKKISMP